MNTNEILQDFYIEAEELCDEAEDSLLAIEKTEDYLSCYNSIFRAFHSIKGAAGMFGLEKLQEHMHFVENLLEQKKKNKGMSSVMVDYLLGAIDAAKKILKNENIDFKYYDPDALPIISKNEEIIDPKVKQIIKNQASLRASSEELDGTIIVVDDEIEICNLIKTFLEDCNYTVHVFTSAQDVLAKLESINPDLIISDFKMPEMNGVELMGKVNKIKPHLPIILVSGFVTTEVCLDAMACGVSGIIEKPYDPEHLQSMTHILVNRYKNLKLLKKSLDLLVYQFEDFDAFMLEKFGESKRDAFRNEIRSLLKQKKLLFDNLN